MDKMKLEESKILNTDELLLEQIKYQYQIDSFVDDFPNDIENWNLEWQFDDFRSETTYQFWIKFYEIENDEFIINGYFSKYKNSNI